jgi:hypothetical protein
VVWCPAVPIELAAGVASGGMGEGFLEPVCGSATSSWPPPNLARVNAPATTSIAAACVELAWTSSPAKVNVRCRMVEPSCAWGETEPNLRPDKPIYKRKGPANAKLRPNSGP